MRLGALGPPHGTTREAVRNRELEQARRAGWPELNRDDLVLHRYGIVPRLEVAAARRRSAAPASPQGGAPQRHDTIARMITQWLAHTPARSRGGSTLARRSRPTRTRRPTQLRAGSERLADAGT